MIWLRLVMVSLAFIYNVHADERVPIKAVGIPLADHYAGVVAYEKYAPQMKHANYTLKLVNGPELVRAYFRSYDDVDLAFNVTPMVVDMFLKKPDFKWVSLIHTDGNALAVNEKLHDALKNLSFNQFVKTHKEATGEPLVCGVPSPLATHTAILYKFLKENNLTLGSMKDQDVDVRYKVIKPPASPSFLRSKQTRNEPALIEQSLPWPLIAQRKKDIAPLWYSKDILKAPNGHVECIIIAKNHTIQSKKEALQEVIFYIHQAGKDIEYAIENGGEAMEKIVQMIQKHIPSHSAEVIKESLNKKIKAISYNNLNIDSSAKESFKEIMQLSYEAKLLRNTIDVEAIADTQFVVHPSMRKEQR